MFLSDPALRRIAACTADVWPDHVWRHHTGTHDSTGELARLLHRATLAFTNATANLDQRLTVLGQDCDNALRSLRAQAFATSVHLVRHLAEVLAELERHQLSEDMLLEAYRAWRANHPGPNPQADQQYLLMRPSDPTWGVATLRRHDQHIWLVIPDAEAAARFEVPYPNRVVGGVVLTDNGWQPTAYHDPQHLSALPALTYPLPACGRLPAACRTLMRWWALRHSADWRNRTPNQLTAAELDQLAD
jgi:hypothetical protein